MKYKILLGIMLVLMVQPLFADDTVGGPGGTFLSQIQNEGSNLARRSKLNFTGAGVDCVDNSTDKRVDCTISAIGSSGPAPAFAVSNNGVLVSSPTSTINFMTPLTVSLQGSTTAQIGLQKISLSTAVTGTLDISTQTNLVVTNPIILTNDTLSLSLISLSTGVLGPLLISSGTITTFYPTTVTFPDGTQQTTAFLGSAGDITGVTAGTGLTGGGLTGSVTLNVDPAYTGFLWNTGSLQTGATAYPQFLNVGTSGALIHGILNVDGVITASNTAITTGAGLLDATKLIGTVPDASIDESSITKRGNVFNSASELLLLDGSGLVPDANLSTNVSLLGQTIDISAETNLAAQSPLSMSGDTIIISTGGLLISTETLQAGTTFFVASGTVAGKLYVKPQGAASPGTDSATSGTLVVQGTDEVLSIMENTGAYTPLRDMSIGFYATPLITGVTAKVLSIGYAGTNGILGGGGFSVKNSAGTKFMTAQTTIDGSLATIVKGGVGVFDTNDISNTWMINGSIGVAESSGTSSLNPMSYSYISFLNVPASGCTISLPSLSTLSSDSGRHRIYRFCRTDSSTGTVAFSASGGYATDTPGFSAGTCVDMYGSVLTGFWRSIGISDRDSISYPSTVSSSITFNGATLFLSSSPAVLSSSQNDYNFGSRSVVRSSASTPVNITGFANGVDGLKFQFINVGTTTITLQNQNAGSSAANRIITVSGSDDGVAAKDSRRLWYDTIDQRWRIIN